MAAMPEWAVFPCDMRWRCRRPATGGWPPGGFALGAFGGIRSFKKERKKINDYKNNIRHLG